jgi:DNA primase
MKIDIERIKSELSMQAVLEHYGINSLRMSGNNLIGCCPVHKGDNKNAFHVSLDKNLWNCFTRQHGGDVLSFIMEYEGVEFKEAVSIARAIINSPDYKSHPCLCGACRQACPVHEPQEKSEKLNHSLKFKLKLDPEHSYLKERGLKKETIEYFGLGLCKKGIFKDRIAIPIHDEHGNLVAYSGRSVNGEKPKYKFPRGFNKSLVVFNIHRARKLEAGSLVIVEGFFDTFRVHQAGFPGVVALMGSFISEKQKELILSLNRKLVILLDGDDAGRAGTGNIIKAFRGKLPMIVKYLPSGIQPDNMAEKELQKLLKTERRTK